MIKTNIQYNQLRKKVEAFQAAYEMYKLELDTKELHPIQMKFYLDSYEREHNKNKALIEEYEQIRDKKKNFIVINKPADIPKILIHARIAMGWSQKDLAEKLMIHEQQIQRIEQNDYLNTSLERVIQVFEQLEIDILASKTIQQTVVLKQYSSQVTEEMKNQGHILQIKN